MENDPINFQKRFTEPCFRWTSLSITIKMTELAKGPSYWGHAAGKMYDYLQILYDITGEKFLFSMTR